MFTVAPIRALADNYIWRLHLAKTDSAVVVDPGEAAAVIDDLDKHHLRLTAIMITHHHGDHVGGIRRLLEVYGDIPVYGPASEQIPAITERLKEGDEISPPGLGVSFKVMDVPGHTAGHIAYYGGGALFCGDTVFAAGCGRVFDGTMQQLAASLLRIAKLPPETLLYCAHEYTLDNIGFAKWVEPDNHELIQREKDVLISAGQGIPTVPSTLEMELKTNPFLRLDDPGVIVAAERKAGRKLESATQVFTVLRQWKDSEYD